jgi:hypothetical protein
MSYYALGHWQGADVEFPNNPDTLNETERGTFAFNQSGSVYLSMNTLPTVNDSVANVKVTRQDIDWRSCLRLFVNKFRDKVNLLISLGYAKIVSC